MDAIFFVISPFQLLCAIEARELLARDDSCELVVINREANDSTTTKHLMPLIDDRWSRVTHVRETKAKGLPLVKDRLWIAARVMARRLSWKGVRPVNVFLGEPRIKWLNTLGRFLGGSVVWLDDGAATIFLISAMLKKNSVSTKSQLPQLFTLFGTAQLTADTNGAIVQNKMLELQRSRRFGQAVGGRYALILGQWLSESKEVTEDKELMHIAAIVSKLKGYDVIYVPHRHEAEQKLSKIKAMGITVRMYDQPIELALRDSAQLPAIVVSWYSTALFTTARLFPEIKVVSVRLDFQHSSEKRRRDVDEVYEAMHSFGLTVVPHDQLAHLTSLT